LYWKLVSKPVPLTSEHDRIHFSEKHAHAFHNFQISGGEGIVVRGRYLGQLDWVHAVAVIGDPCVRVSHVSEIMMNKGQQVEQ
jgi:hypothetical protein